MKKFLICTFLVLIASTPINKSGAVGFAHLYNKTYADVMAFLQSDQTHKLTYTNTFNCVEFSETMAEHARAQGFLIARVDVTLDTGFGHEFVAFYTIDRGIVYIEPQNNAEFARPEGNLCLKSGVCYTGYIINIQYIY